MPSIGFTTMKEKILSGEKKQTIRRARKRRIKYGDTLYLYWHLRRKDCELLKEVIAKKTLKLRWKEFAYDNEVARRDGFNDSAEMRVWFTNKYGEISDDELFDIIRW